MKLSVFDRFRNGPVQAPVPQWDGLAQVRAYWEALRRTNGLPTRASLDPRGFGGILDRIFLAERVGRGIAQIRIAGSSLNAFAQMDLRGLPLGCLFAADSRPLLAESLEAVFLGPSVCEADLGSDRSARGTACARMTLLPLASEDGRQLLLGAIGFARSDPRRCKLQILGRRVEHLQPELPAEHLDLPAPRPAPIRVSGHLALVHSAD